MEQASLFPMETVRRNAGGIAFIERRLPLNAMLTPQDIASALDTKADTVYRWIDEGRFGCVDVGSGAGGRRRWRIDRASFLEFLATRVDAQTGARER